MYKLFIEGGWQFMSLITILALIMLFFAVKGAVAVFNKSRSFHSGDLYYIRFFGMLALVFGVLGQILGLYQAMQAIAEMGEVSQQVLAGGIKVTSITTLYGFLVFIIAHILWFVLDSKEKKDLGSL